MGSLEQVFAELRRFAIEDRAEAVCIAGDWGVGKTYSWNFLFDSAVKEGRVAKKRYSYASLFGISSLDGLKSSIFENTNILIDPNAQDEDLNELKKHGNKIIEFAKKNKSLFPL